MTLWSFGSFVPDDGIKYLSLLFQACQFFVFCALLEFALVNYASRSDMQRDRARERMERARRQWELEHADMEQCSKDNGNPASITEAGLVRKDSKANLVGNNHSTTNHIGASENNHPNSMLDGGFSLTVSSQPWDHNLNREKPHHYMYFFHRNVECPTWPTSHSMNLTEEQRIIRILILKVQTSLMIFSGTMETAPWLTCSLIPRIPTLLATTTQPWGRAKFTWITFPDQEAC